MHYAKQALHSTALHISHVLTIDDRVEAATWLPSLKSKTSSAA